MKPDSTLKMKRAVFQNGSVFAERPLGLRRMQPDNDPESWSAGLRPGAIASPHGWLVPDRRSALQFRESVRGLVVVALLASLASGCSFRKMAVNRLGDALAAGGATFASDDDPELVKDAAPFSLKLMESLLAESPKHKGLLFATASGFTQYAFAFVQQDADETEEKDLSAATELRVRARKLYLRARNYALRGLELNHGGFEKALRQNPNSAMRITGRADVPWLYWAAVSWAAAISNSKDNPDLIGDLPMVEALIDRALELDEGYDSGAIHSFLISYEMSRQRAEGKPEDRARRHFARAMELGGGQLAGPLVALAEAVSVKNQNVVEFKDLLNRTLAIDPNAKPEWRLVNSVLQRRARWLLSRTDELFLPGDKP
jgi:predicted anti-sigma-YlaC factor YlaD